jgi:hypothetical protein
MGKKKETKKVYLDNIRKKLDNTDSSSIIHTLNEIKYSGIIETIPIVISLLNKNKDQFIKKEVISLLGDIKDQKATSIIVKEISNKKNKKILAELLSTCWMSRLDYSMYLKVFTDCFIHEDFVTALEAFTVIEESLHNATNENINSYREDLISRRSEITSEKQVLFRELLKVIDGKY